MFAFVLKTNFLPLCAAFDFLSTGRVACQVRNRSDVLKSNATHLWAVQSVLEKAKAKSPPHCNFALESPRYLGHKWVRRAHGKWAHVWRPGPEPLDSL